MRAFPLGALLLHAAATPATASSPHASDCASYAMQAREDLACRQPDNQLLATACAAINTGAASWCFSTITESLANLERLIEEAEKGGAADPAARAKLRAEMDEWTAAFEESFANLSGLSKDPRLRTQAINDFQLNDFSAQFMARQEHLERALNDADQPAPAERPGAPDSREFLASDAARREREALAGGEGQELALNLAGTGYLAAGKPGDARRVGQTLVKRAPDDPAGHALLAESEFALGRAREAKAAAEEALRLDPKNKKARSVLGFAEATIRGERKVSVAPPDLGGNATETAHALPAGRRAGPAPATAPVGMPPMIRRALERLRLNDDLGALDAINRHLDTLPGDAEALLIRSDILLRLKKPAPALADAEAVLALQPGDARALRAQAAALLDLGRHAEALAAIDRALALDPASGQGHFLRARILEALGRVPEAIAAYRKAAALDEAVAPLAEAALARLGAAPAAASGSAAVPRRLLRGGLITVSLALILLGLIGGALVVTRRRAATLAAEAAARPAERTLKEGDLVAGQYRIVRELGRGGMGVVFEAVDETLKRPVALKQLQADFRMSAEDAARFLQEARLVAQVRHPNVAEIYAAVEDGGLFLVFELVKGRSLDAWAGAGLTPEQARGVVASACAALEAAHARRIVHRDLKPSNLMVGDDGVVKVMDFGIAHQSRGGATQTQTAASGTPPYMAPEQAMGAVSASSDLYALAVMAYELLCGKRPFEGPDFLGPKLRGEFKPVTARRPGLPARLDAFFESALASDPAKRPADAKAFRAAFDACWS